MPDEPAFTRNGLCVNCGEKRRDDPPDFPRKTVQAMIRYAERATNLGFMVSFNDLIRVVLDEGEVVRIEDVQPLEDALAVFADFADRIDGFEQRGPPSPLLAIRDECEAAREVLTTYRNEVRDA